MHDRFRHDVPRVSTMGSFLMIALFFTIRITPSASVTVTTMGKPSGMAATARLREERRRQTYDLHPD